MTGELHKRGYQGLRVIPCMSNSGAHWRCWLTPVDNIRRGHGALAENTEPENAVLYTSAMGSHYFDWQDATELSARQLADLFVERYPRIVSRSQVNDWCYAGWLVRVLGLAEEGHFPIAYTDGWWPDDGAALSTIQFGDHAGEPQGIATPPLPSRT